MINKAKLFAANLARADMVFWLLPPLMLVLTAGTLAQAPLGLYAAQKLFFGFILWAGPVPLPGGYMLIAIISFSLLVKFLLHSEWTSTKSEINLTHFGVLVLLFGGLLTATMAKESFMILPEGSESAYLYDYQDRKLYIFKDDVLQQSIDFANLEKKITGVPFELDITESCTNCAIVKREEQGKFLGMAQFMQLKPAPQNKEPEADIPGLTFTIKGLKEQDGTYIAFEGMPKPIELATKDHNYKIIFGKQQTLLPFSVRLKDFTRETYPGTDKARAYSSDVIIMDNGIEWPARIEMNQPLRYKGYTFYQSSFEQTDEMQASVLSVVENKGRIFPYLGTLIMAAGLLLHIWIVFRTKTSGGKA